MCIRNESVKREYTNALVVLLFIVIVNANNVRFVGHKKVIFFCFPEAVETRIQSEVEIKDGNDLDALNNITSPEYRKYASAFRVAVRKFTIYFCKMFKAPAVI